MQRWLNNILKTARTAAFISAACALHAAGAQARQDGSHTNQPPKETARVETASRETQPEATRRAQSEATPTSRLSHGSTAVAAKHAADGATTTARPLPPAGRVGVDEAEPLPLTLEEAVRRALENNNDIDAARVDVSVAEHELSAERGAYDPRLTSETYFERSTRPTASFLAGGRGGSLKTTDFAGTFGFEGLAQRAGGSYRFEFSSRRTATNNVFNDLNPTVSHGFTFGYTQPLLRGRRTDDARRRVEIAKKNLALSDAQFRRRAVEIITNVEQAYWELAYALRNLQIQNEAVGQARAQAESDRRQVERGVIAPVDLLETETQVKNFEQEVYAAQERVARAENALKKMLTADRAAELWARALLPVSPVNLEAPRVALEDAVRSALANRLELAELSTSAEINRIDQRFQRDQKRPQVDLTASYSSNALAGSVRDEENPLVSGLASLQNRVNQLSSLSGLPALPPTSFAADPDLVGGYGRSLRSLLAQNNPTVKVGVRISLPLGNRRARAEYGRALAEGRRIENRRAQAEQTIEAEVRDTLQALRSIEARLAAATSARATAEQQYASERRKFQSGLSTAYMVSQRQVDLTTARGRELQAQTDLSKSLADFRRVTGGTLEAHSVALRPGDPSRRFEQTNTSASALTTADSASALVKE